MTRFAKLTLLLIVAGAFALAGCGGDDNGLSAEDQARISAIEDAAEMAAAEAEQAKMDAAAAEAEAEAAKTAADAAQAEADQAKQDAAAAQMTADEAQMTADADEDLTPEQAVMATWEALFTPAVETRFTSMVGTNPTIASIAAAIATIADMYDVAIPGGNRATLDAMLIVHFSTADPTPSTALAYFQMLRSGGFLPATQQRALMVLTSNTTSHQWEATFAPSVEKMFSDMVGDDPTQEKIRMEIQNIARAYGVDPPSTAALQASIQDYFKDNPREGTALGFFRMYRADYNFLPATADRVADVIADRMPSGTTTTADMDDMDDDPPAMTAAETAEKIAALLDNVAATTSGLADGNFINKVAFTGTASMEGDVTLQGGVATVAGSNAGRYEAQLGYWLDESFVIGTLKSYDADGPGDENPVPLPFAVGMPAGTNPTGPAGAKLQWNGGVTGYWNPTDDTPDAGQIAASGAARITVTISEALGGAPTAMLEIPNMTAGGTSVAINDSGWEAMGITRGGFSAPGVQGRFLTGHTAVVGELNHVNADDTTATAPAGITEPAGSLTAAFGAVKE